MIEVSEFSHSALSKFNDILLLPALAEHENDVQIQKWIDERGRMRIWTANTGAHHRGVLSIDYRLRDLPIIKKQTINILQRLRALLETLEEVLYGDGVENSKDEALLAEDKNYADLEFNGSEISHIFKTVVETITQLYQIATAIDPLSDHDRLMETEKLNSELRAIHGDEGESQEEFGNEDTAHPLSKLLMTNTSVDSETQQVLLRHHGTQFALTIPAPLAMRREMTVGALREMAAETLGLADTSKVKLISKGYLLKDDGKILEETWFEQSGEIMCMTSGAEETPAPTQGDGSNYDRKHVNQLLEGPTSLFKNSFNETRRLRTQWWTCCKCGQMVNPLLGIDNPCPVCDHDKCSYCRKELVR